MHARLLAVPVVVALALTGGGAAYAHPDTSPGVTHDEDGDHHQHGTNEGHLPASKKNVKLVSKLDMSGATGEDREDHIGDVTAFGKYAYLAARRLNTDPCGLGGFYTVNIANPSRPKEVSFTPFPKGSYPGEGMHVIRVKTATFKGDVLITNNEICDAESPTAVGGVSLYDVTNPRNIKPLAIGRGDTNEGTEPRAHEVHSAFGWQAGKRAFVIMNDNEEVGDVDILEITDPVNPVQIAETGILDWPDAQKPLAHGETVYLHDMVVKKIKGHYYGLLSYWDVGWVILNLDDPAKPKFVDDSDYPKKDLLGFSPQEGNAHQAEWSSDNRYIIGTDEDFSPTRTFFSIADGPNAGNYQAGQFDWTRQIDTLPGKTFAGKTVWGGSGCEEDVDGNGTSDRAEVPTKEQTRADIVVFTRGVCFFSKKVESGQLAGYDKVIVIQSHTGSRNGLFPNGFTCGAMGHEFEVTAAGVCIGHRAGHLLFNDTPEYTSTPEGSDLPARGTLGASVKAQTKFDGWGGVNLLDARSLRTIDQYAIDEALDDRYAQRFGDLTVHEVATDPKRNLGYLSYYSGGIRVIKFGRSGIREVGHYIAKGGNNFWGVEVYKRGGRTYILGSDRDSGLWIFRYTGR